MPIRGAMPPRHQRAVTELAVHSASATPSQPVPILRIHAVEFLDDRDQDALRDLYVREGEQLAEALCASLPAGTIDQLLAALLLRRASLLKQRL